MENHTYKKIELIGTSDQSMEAAIENAISKASNSIDEMSWFEVTETRGNLKNGEVEQWQVGVKIGFTLKD